MKVTLFLLAMSGCVPPARPVVQPVPAPVRALGGFYQPWTPLHETHWAEVLACVGVSATGPRPSIWIVSGALTQDGRELAALYEPETHAIVVVLDALPYYWLLFRHEAIHASVRDADHAQHFAKAAECHFWPAR